MLHLLYLTGDIAHCKFHYSSTALYSVPLETWFGTMMLKAWHWFFLG